MAVRGRAGTFFRRSRFALALLFFGWSLMVVLPAPRMPLFFLTLTATELGHWLALPALMLAFAGSRKTWPGIASVVMGFVAAALFLSSAVRASELVRSLPADFERAFGDGGDAAAPFEWSRLWSLKTGPQPAVETMTFAEHEGAPLKLDFFRCRSRPLAPCVIAIHGGGWDSGTRAEFAELNRRLAAHGFAVASIDYRLAPKSAWPAQREDVHAALEYLRGNAATLGLDGRQFILLGRSAGGQIAEAVAYDAPDPAIRGIVALYAPADLHFAFQFADPKDILNSYQLLKDYMGGTPDEARANYDSASAILHVRGQSVPTLLLHGRRDSLVWYLQSERLAERLQAAGARHLFVELPWATHAFDVNPNGPGGQIAEWSITQFLRAVTDPPTAKR